MPQIRGTLIYGWIVVEVWTRSAHESELTPCTEPWYAPGFGGYVEEAVTMDTNDQDVRTEARENRVREEGVWCPVLLVG